MASGQFLTILWKHVNLVGILILFTFCLSTKAQQGQEPDFRLPEGGVPGPQQFNNFQANDNNNNLPLLPPVFVPGEAQAQQQQRPNGFRPFSGGGGGNGGAFNSVTSSVTSFFNRILRFFN